MFRHHFPIVLLFSAGVIILAACGGGGPAEPTATPTPNFTAITSDDGKLTLEIPLGIVADDIEITITTVANDDLPIPLRNVRGAGAGYLLEPDGLEFSEPVTARLTLDRSELDAEEEDTITAYALVTQNADGELEVLPEQLMEWTLGEETVTVSGQLSHFSWIVRTKGSLTVSLDKIPREHPVGSTFTAEGQVGNGDLSGGVTFEGTNGEFLAFGKVSTTGETKFASTENQILDPGQSIDSTGNYKCSETPGLGTYSLRGKATSRVTGDQGIIRTPLSVIVDGVIKCVAPDEPTATPPPSPTPDESPVATPTPESTSSGDAGVDGMLSLIGVPRARWDEVVLPPDPLGDHIFSIPNVKPGFTPGFTDILGTANFTLDMPPGDAANLNQLLPCGLSFGMSEVVCGQGAGAFPSGPLIVTGMHLAAAPPVDPERNCTYAAVFDQGAAWQTQGDYFWDSYQGAGKWYELSLDPGPAVDLSTTQVGGNQQTQNVPDSNARVLILREANMIVFLIPQDEVPDATGFRLTTFCHDGTFAPGQSGLDVPGANPTGGLAPFSSVIFTDGFESGDTSSWSNAIP